MTEEQFTTLPDARATFVALVHRSKDGTAEGVPPKRQDDYWEHVSYQTAGLAKRYAEICREYGGSTLDTVPENRRNECALHLWEWRANFANRCEFELAIKKARDAYDAETAEADFG